MAAGARVCSEFYSDIIDEIRTNYDDDDDDERIHTLASCCLVSKAWLGEIRSTRWRSLDLNDGNIDSFCGLLDTVPDIGSYVARLDIDLGYDNYGDLAGDNNDPGPSSDDEVFADTVEELLPKLPNLVHLSIDIPIVRRSFFTGSAKLRHLGLWNCHIQDGVDGLRACLRILPQLQSLQLKKIYFPEGRLDPALRRGQGGVMTPLCRVTCIECSSVIVPHLNRLFVFDTWRPPTFDLTIGSSDNWRESYIGGPGSCRQHFKIYVTCHPFCAPRNEEMSLAGFDPHIGLHYVEIIPHEWDDFKSAFHSIKTWLGQIPCYVDIICIELTPERAAKLCLEDWSPAVDLLHSSKFRSLEQLKFRLLGEDEHPGIVANAKTLLETQFASFAQRGILNCVTNETDG